MEFRDRPAWQCPFPHPRHGDGCSASSSYSFQFLLLTFHLPLLDGLGEGCPFRGSPWPHMVAPPHTHTAQAKGFPLPTCCVHCQCCAHPVSPLPHSAHIFLGPRSLGGRGQVGGPGSEFGGRARRCSVTSRWCPLGRGPEEEGGVPGGYFSIFYFQIFLYLNLQICIIPG